MASNQIRSLHTAMTNEIKALDRSDPDSLEAWMKSKAVQVPDTHQLVREVQYGLVCLFKLDNPELMNNSQLLRKSVLCRFFKNDLINQCAAALHCVRVIIAFVFKFTRYLLII